MNIKNKVMFFILNFVVINQVLLCGNEGITLLDNIIYTENEKQYNRAEERERKEEEHIHYDWNKIFGILDSYKIDPNEYHYTKESQRGWKPTLLELAAKNEALHAIAILMKKYKERYPNTKEALYEAIYNNHVREFRRGRRVNELLLMQYGAHVKWDNEEEFLRFILDPRFTNYSKNSADAQETKDIIRKVLENSKMKIHWNTYKKVIGQRWGEWWHWGIMIKEHPKDNPNNKAVEDYIRNQKANK